MFHEPLLLSLQVTTFEIGFSKLTRIHWLDRWIVRKQPNFEDFEVKYLEIANFVKNRFSSNLSSYLVLTSGQKPKKSLDSFLRKISKCLILG